MLSHNIKSCTPQSNSISFVVHLNNLCNFKCNYCIAGREFSKEELTLDDVLMLIDSIIKLKSIIGNNHLHIDITGGEPTLHKEFINILKLFIDIENVYLQISTNGLLLSTFDLGFIENKNTIFFNISFHYFEYKNKVELFIKSINKLISYGVNFNIKFLLPNEGETLENFLNIKNYIINSTGIDKDKYKNYLIIDTDGEVSKTYDKKVLDYYNFSDTTFSYDTNIVSILYENGESKEYLFEELKAGKMNNYKGYDCFYISKDNVSIHISPSGEVILGTCRTLDKMRYKLEDLENILSSTRKITCPESTCISGLGIPKKRTTLTNKIEKIENYLVHILTKIIIGFSLFDISINLKKEIKVILFDSKYNIYINVYISNKNNGLYYYQTENIGISLKIKNSSNIVFNLEDLNDDFKLLIQKNIILLSKIEKIFISALK